MYFRLSPRELTALRSGQHLLFATGPRPAVIARHAGVGCEELQHEPHHEQETGRERDA